VSRGEPLGDFLESLEKLSSKTVCVLMFGDDELDMNWPAILGLYFPLLSFPGPLRLEKAYSLFLVKNGNYFFLPNLGKKSQFGKSSKMVSLLDFLRLSKSKYGQSLPFNLFGHGIHLLVVFQATITFTSESILIGEIGLS
jgi:hypothetical protein